MFRYIFLGLLVLNPALLYGTPEWICQDPSGCPIVNNTCPTCSKTSVTTKTPEKPPIIIQKVKREVVREVIREVPSPTIVHHVPIIPPSVSFTNSKVILSGLTWDSYQWKTSVRVGSFSCIGPRIDRHTVRGNLHCNGESSEYFVIRP